MSGPQSYPESLYGPGNGGLGGSSSMGSSSNGGNGNANGGAGNSGYFQRPSVGRNMNDDRYRNGSSYSPNEDYMQSHRQSHPRQSTQHFNNNNNNVGPTDVGFDYNRQYSHNSDSMGQQMYKNNANGNVDSRREFENRRPHHSDSTSSMNSISTHASNLSSPHNVMIPNRGEGYGRPPPPPQYGGGMYDSRRENSSSESLQHKSSGLPADAGPSGSNNQPDRKVSCLECRSSKVKCSGQAEGGCDRCKRIKRACVFEQHRRGRKPAQVKMHKLEQSVDTIMTALSALTEYKRSKEASNSNAIDEEDDEEDYHRSAEKPTQGRKRRAESDTSTTNGEPSKYAKSNSVPTLHRHDLSSPDEQFGTTTSHGGKESNRFSAMLEDVSGRARRFLSSRSPSTIDMPTSKSEPTDVLGTNTEAASQELGQPPLSNPLKLLAQASDSNVEPARVDTIAQTPLKEDSDDGEEIENQTVDASGKSQTTKSAKFAKGTQTRGASRRGYWSIGMYSSRLDKGSTLDPISQGLMSHDVARDLYGLYMRHLNAPITLLDPILHTFSFVRSHSALLLSASCALAARFASHINNAEEIANKLDSHIQDVLLPTILLKGYRSVEISQAFIILAAYHSNTQSLDGDRSWSLVGYGIRIAAELDMNARLLSEWSSMAKNAQTPTSVQADTPLSNKLAEDDIQFSPEEATQRRLRNRERTWCNLWLFEYSLSTHMGRRSTLSQDPVILGVSAGWHRAAYAIPGDEAIVALIGLRRIQIKNTEFFEHSILSTSYDRPQINSAASRFQLDFYRKASSADITNWTAMYVEREEGSSYRMRNASLYASYARLILNSYALKCTSDEELLDPFYKESYSAAMTYLSMYSERFRTGLTYVHNSSVVTVAYVAVFALKLCSLDSDRHPYIDPKLVIDHVRELADALAKAGSVTSWRNGAASSYAPYLRAVAERVERNVRMEQGRRASFYPSDNGENATGEAENRGTEAEEAANRNGDGSSVPDDLDTPPKSAEMNKVRLQGVSPRDSGQQSNGIQSSVNLLQPTTQNHGMGPPTSAPTPRSSNTFAFGPGFTPQTGLTPGNSQSTKFAPEALTFLAGPSGVQAATVLDELAVGEDYLRFGVPQNGQDHHQFLEGSLFGDMSVFLNAASAVNDNTFPWSIGDTNEQGM
ncbi:uncharacterized protein FA14DRAFT_191140 [Meira miltonrushii]|uniref:Zn(2)-C6 fungal-type domain-containing protein n=1 Tax=Meira miltonrushii TaxID=1280837 RepID=A0A316V943_9BASI|nr:uncharacterized protein FA14DRAFT_191140 [Meira miltonrushii]PWN34046.1 hypothetical protein FA14DRAFT_191140 [Meira miltonrushii]